MKVSNMFYAFLISYSIPLNKSQTVTAQRTDVDVDYRIILMYSVNYLGNIKRNMTSKTDGSRTCPS